MRLPSSGRSLPILCWGGWRECSVAHILPFGGLGYSSPRVITSLFTVHLVLQKLDLRSRLDVIKFLRSGKRQ